MENHSLSSLEGLSALGSRGGVDMRPTLLRILTDLYVQKLTHTPDEQRHYTELALRLLEVVDMPTRLAVAKRLGRHLAPPLSVLQRLLADLPEVAAPVRAHPLLQSLRRRAAAGSARTPVARPDVPMKPLPMKPLAPNGTPAADDANLFADTVQTIDAATAHELNELFFATNAEERRLILLNLDIVAPLPPGRVGVLRDPSVGKQLEAAALARRHEEFAQLLAQALQIPREQARRMVRDDLGEPLVIAAKSLGLPSDRLYRILMFVNPAVGHSVQRVHALAALYEEMTPQAAEGMVAIWQALHKHAPASYRPLLSGGAAPRPRERAATAQRTPAAPANDRRNAF